MSIVPEGDGAELLEFGEQRPEFRSLKAEIAFPVTTQLQRNAPFDKLLSTPTLTTCGGCHPGSCKSRRSRVCVRSLRFRCGRGPKSSCRPRRSNTSLQSASARANRSVAPCSTR